MWFKIIKIILHLSHSLIFLLKCSLVRWHLNFNFVAKLDLFSLKCVILCKLGFKIRLYFNIQLICTAELGCMFLLHVHLLLLFDFFCFSFSLIKVCLHRQGDFLNRNLTSFNLLSRNFFFLLFHIHDLCLKYSFFIFLFLYFFRLAIQNYGFIVDICFQVFHLNRVDFLYFLNSLGFEFDFEFLLLNFILNFLDLYFVLVLEIYFDLFLSIFILLNF